MSLFVTKIPTNLAVIIAKLPKNAFINGTKFNPATGDLELSWEHDKLKTKHTFPWPFPIANLDGDLPVGVTMDAPPKPVTDKAPEIIVKESIDTKAKSVRKPRT